jgi:hypothetical protein
MPRASPGAVSGQILQHRPRAGLVREEAEVRLLRQADLDLDLQGRVEAVLALLLALGKGQLGRGGEDREVVLLRGRPLLAGLAAEDLGDLVGHLGVAAGDALVLEGGEPAAELVGGAEAPDDACL